MKVIFTFISLLCIYNTCTCNQSYERERKYPTVLIATLIRNKAHTLPYFFTYLESQNYPKDRIALWFRSDHNEDNSIEIIHLWLNKTARLYHDVDFKYKEYPVRHQNESTPTDWPKERFSHIIQLKEEAFEKAKQFWADFIFFLDADVFLTNPDSLKHLTAYNLPIVAPKLLSEGLYSNFWCGMSDDYYYQRTDEYKEIYNNKKIGDFPVPMVHTAVLVNLNGIKSDLLTFDRQKLIRNQRHITKPSRLYDGPLDDIIIFAISANTSGIPMFISNNYSYGYLLQPLEKEDDIRQDYQLLVNTKVNMINDLDDDIKINNEFKQFIFYPEKHKLSLDHIYMINLRRRPERRVKMELSFRELGLDVENIAAVDGRELNISIIEKMGIRFLPGYEDPYHHRQMTMGEIGCFLSHYNIWQKIIELGQKEVLILEDDIRFEPYFKESAIRILKEARNVGGWDLIYFGRKRLEDQDEPWVDRTQNLVYVGYSYWTLGYVITLEGAKKLIDIKPLEKLIPVDEFLPVMFDRHPNDTWSSAFEPRNLRAFSASPLILFPTHYTGEEGYISDTEDSQITPIKPNGPGVQLKSDKERINKDKFESFMETNHINSKQNVVSKHTFGKRDPGDL